MEQPTPKKRRRWPWIVLIVAATLGIIVLVAFPPIASSIADAKIREYVETHYTGRAEFDSVSVNWSGEAVVENLRLIPADGRDLATVRRVYVDVAVWEFLGGQRDYVIELSGITADIRKNPDGTTNLDAFLVSPIQHPVTPLPPTRLDLTVTDAVVDYDGKRVELSRAAYKTADLNASGALSAEARMNGGRVAVTGDVSLASDNAVSIAGSVKTLIESLPLAPLHARLAGGALDGTVTLDLSTRDALADLTVRDLSLDDGTRVPRIEIEGGAKALTVTTGRSVRLDVTIGDRIDVKAVADVAEIVEMLREPLKIKEGVALTGSFAAEGSYAADTVTGWLRLRDVKTADGVEIEKDARIEVDAAFGGGTIDVRKLDVKSSAVTATGSGRISGTELTGATLDATADLNLLGAKLSAFMEIDLAGTLKARVTSEGQRVTLDADAVGLKAPGLAAPIDVAIDAIADGTAIESLTLRSAPLDATASGRYAEVLAVAWRATVRPDSLGTALGQPMSGAPFEATGSLTGPLDALVAEIKTSIAQIKHETYQFTNINVEARARADGTIETLAVGSDALTLQGATTNGVFEGTFSVEPANLGRWLAQDLQGETARGTFRREGDRIEGGVTCPRWGRLHDLKVDVEATLSATVTARVWAQEGVIDVAGTLPGPLSVKGSGSMRALGDEFGGLWTCDVTVRQEGDTFHIDGAETIADLVVVHDARRVEDKRVTLIQKATFQDGRLDIEDLRVESEILSGTLNGSVSFDPTVTYLHGLRLDVKYVPDKLGVILARYAPGEMAGAEPQVFQGTIDGPLDADHSIVNLLREAGNVDFFATLDAYTLFGFRISGAVRGTHESNRAIHLNMPLKANGGTLVAGGDLDLRRPEIYSNLTLADVAVNRDVTELIQRMHPIFKDVDGELSGTANGRVMLYYRGPLPIPEDRQQAAIDHLTGSGSLHIQPMTLKGSPFLDAILTYMSLDPKDEQGEFYLPEFVMKDGYLAYDALRIRLSGLTLGFSGRVYYNQRLHLEMVIPVSEEAGRANGKLASLVGVPLRVPIRGTISEPEFRWDEAILNAIKDKGKKELEKKLKDLLPFK